MQGALGNHRMSIGSKWLGRVGLPCFCLRVSQKHGTCASKFKRQSCCLVQDTSHGGGEEANHVAADHRRDYKLGKDILALRAERGEAAELHTDRAHVGEAAQRIGGHQLAPLVDAPTTFLY